MFEHSFSRLKRYIEKEGFKGYDPYDTLNGWIPFYLLGNWGPILAIQFQKRNPKNLRPLIGIKKEYNPKAMGLFLHAYSLLFQKQQKSDYKRKADFFFDWLANNYSKGYSGYSWGYNFPWATSVKYIEPFVPSAVVTGFVCRGIYEYYKINPSERILDIINSASKFIRNDLQWTRDQTGICISYTPKMIDICYNASLMAAETLAYNYQLNGKKRDLEDAIKAVTFVAKRQKNSGMWAYSEGGNGKERIQTDFHQGYVIESIYRILKISEQVDAFDSSLHHIKSFPDYILKGLHYYRKKQFDKNGRSFWRLPKKWPVEIHNQAQGIIIFKLFEEIAPEYRNFSQTILKYTIENMQDKNGFFYYQKFPTHTNKIPYMRWSQAWMFLALATIMDDV